jgi:hypothetical protein
VINGTVIIGAIVYIAMFGGFGAWLASKKHYSAIAWFFICVLTGPVGLIAIAGAPDLKMIYTLEEINRKLSSQSYNTPSVNATPLPTTVVSGQTWFCKKCQTKNPSTSDSCKGCGAYK